MKYRRDRRYGMPIESIGVFHVKVAVEFRRLQDHIRLAGRAGASAGRPATTPGAKTTRTCPSACWCGSRTRLDTLAPFADTAGGGNAVSKKRVEDLARIRIAPRSGQRLALNSP